MTSDDQAQDDFDREVRSGERTAAETPRQRAADPEMNTGVSDTDAPSPQQQGGEYIVGEGGRAATERQRAADPEMNTGVSDTDLPSPQQQGGDYIVGETTDRP